MSIIDMSLPAVLERIEQGKSTLQDAERVREWIMPNLQWMIVGAHLCLMSYCEEARKWIAPDLRQELARRLTEDIKHE